MSDVSSLAIASIGATTGAAALAVTWWKTVRDARAELPVSWSVRCEEESAPAGAKHPVNYVAYLSCQYSRAHQVIVELYHPGAPGMPNGIQVVKRFPLLVEGEEQRIELVNGAPPGTAWVLIYWNHPRDIRRPVKAWFPVLSRNWNGLPTPAANEHIRQTARPFWRQWLRMHIIQSPVHPGRGIAGRSTGWRDRALGRRIMRKAHLAPWSGLPGSENQPPTCF